METVMVDNLYMLLAYFSSLRGKSRCIRTLCTVCVLTSSEILNQLPILTKFGMNIMPLEATPILYFSTSKN